MIHIYFLLLIGIYMIGDNLSWQLHNNTPSAFKLLHVSS